MIKWIIKQDKKDHFRFVPLQDVPVEMLAADAAKMKTVVVMYKGKTFTKSNAALYAGSLLGGGWTMLRVFYIVPAFMRNFVYDTVARYRYKWFGQYEACPIPKPEIRHKFLHLASQ